MAAAVIFLYLSLSCQTSSLAESKPLVAAIDLDLPVQIQPRTLMPHDFQKWREVPYATSKVKVPEKMLITNTVIRPRAQVWRGPGAQFGLTDFVLTAGTPVIVFDQMDVWSKITAPSAGARGWVHRDALGKSLFNAKAITVKASQLPTVAAVREIRRVYAYPSYDVLTASVPKGTMFYVLNSEDGRSLVWLTQTNSVVWVASEDTR